jgi:response regulator RpfG family c-di-GMP phosphodiesterase
MNKQILLIDENYKTAMVMQIILSEYNVLYAQTKDIGMTTLQETTKVDLVIFDFDIPGMNSSKFIDSLRANYSNIKVLTISNDLNYAKKTLADKQVDGFLQGPIVDQKNIRKEVINILN